MNAPIGAELLHEPTGELGWVEVWDNWFVVPGTAIGGYVTLTIRPDDGVSSYWASLVGFERPLVTVLVDDAPLPKPPSMELRASGLWTDTTVLRPFEHLTTDLEAFGVAMDDPTDVWTGAWGDRIAVGLELDWDTEGAPGPSPVAGTTGYRLVGRCHGEVLLGDARHQVEAIGVRDHWWGVPPSTATWRGWASRDGEFIHSDGGRLEVREGQADGANVPSLGDIIDLLPIGEVQAGMRVDRWAPVVSSGRRIARGLVTDERGGGWVELAR